nr:uncharacterized protein LOC131280144 [Dasypus novemcinctus]
MSNDPLEWGSWRVSSESSGHPTDGRHLGTGVVRGWAVPNCPSAWQLAYVGTIRIGTPPRELNVLFDTCLTYLWVPSVSCCSPVCFSNNTFDPGLSSTFLNTTKPVFSFDRGSKLGFVGYDVVQVTGKTGLRWGWPWAPTAAYRTRCRVAGVPVFLKDPSSWLLPCGAVSLPGDSAPGDAPKLPEEPIQKGGPSGWRPGEADVAGSRERRAHLPFTRPACARLGAEGSACGLCLILLLPQVWAGRIISCILQVRELRNREGSGLPEATQLVGAPAGM